MIDWIDWFRTWKNKEELLETYPPDEDRNDERQELVYDANDFIKKMEQKINNHKGK